MNPPRFDDHREHLRLIRAAALAAADPYRAVRSRLRLVGDQLLAGDPTGDALVALPLEPGRQALVAGAGKAGVAMARAVAEALGERLTAGVVAAPHLPSIEDRARGAQTSAASPALERITFISGGHPLPTEGSLRAGAAIRNLLAGTRPGDVVIAPISGGGSALLELPRPGLTLDDLRAANDLLLRSGASVQEINVLRQRLSQIKGGGLARMAAPATVIGLILSDVVGDPLPLIASGPTVAAPPADPLEIVHRYQLASRLPAPVLACLREIQTSKVSETFEVYNREVHNREVYNLLVGSNALAAQAAGREAGRLGFRVRLQAAPLVGEARPAGGAVGEAVRAWPREGRPAGSPVPGCLIWGGETTVTVRGQGRGGRNQELALGAALALRGVARVAVMAFGTDGVDGPTDAAGGIITGESASRGEALGLSAQRALEQNDAYGFLQALGALLITGPTGTNVQDLTVGLAY